MGAPLAPRWPVVHPLALNSYRHWRGVRALAGPQSGAGRIRLGVTSALALLTSPLRASENLLYASRLYAHNIAPPLFILGHWRTGTTHLHNLLCQDEQFAYVDTFQTVMPGAALVGQGWLRKLIGQAMPEKRPMDNMALAHHLPQEEEMAMCNLSPHSFYLGWYFPHEMPSLFTRYVLMEGLTEQELSEWRAAYRRVLATASLLGQGKPLVLKSPTNTGRIPQLLGLFPDARFVHIRRDPYRVFQSTVHLHRATCALVGWRQMPEEEIQRNVLDFYARMMRKYEADKSLIPPGRLVEIDYEDLVRAPLPELEGLYGVLGLGGWAEAQPRIAQYLALQKDYQPNAFRMKPEAIAQIEDQWAFALESGRYPRPSTG